MLRKEELGLITAIVIVALVIGGILYTYLGDGQSPYDGENNGTEHETAPDFTLPVVGGGIVQLSELKGKVVVLDFMATWCSPCGAEIEHLVEIHEKYDNAEVEILSIDVDPNESDGLISSYASERGAAWKFLRDGSSVSLEPEYDARSIPTIVIIDKDGGIAYRNVGVTKASDLEFEIDKLIQ